MPKLKKQKEGQVTTLNEIRPLVRKKVVEKYGSVAQFIKSEDCKKLDIKYIRVFLYNGGPTNSEALSKLCEFLGLGTIKKEIHVERKVTYTFIPAAE